MKTVHSTRIVTVALLLGVALLIAACSTQKEPVDNSPNVTLSNQELLTTALASMTHLNSYHLEFTGGLPSQNVRMSPTLVITADVQQPAKGTRITMRDAGGGAIGSPYLILDVGNGIDVVVTQGSWYERYVGEPQWQKPQTDTPAGFLLAMFGWMWPLSNDGAGTDPSPGPAETLLKALAFRDGTPRTEQLAGVTTRHLVADFNSATMPPDRMAFGGLEGAKTAGVWLSTEMTPTVRQLQIGGSSVVLKHEIGPAHAVAFSPDGKTLAVAHGHAADWVIRLWSLDQPGKPPRKLQSKIGPLWSVSFSPDGAWLAAGTDRAVYVWQVAEWNAAPILLPVDGGVRSVAFRPDGQMLGAAVSNGIYLWLPPYADAKPTVLPHPAQNVVNAVAFSPDNHTVASSNLNAGVRLYDVRQPQAAPTVLPEEGVNALAFSPDGRLLASTGAVKLWPLGQPAPRPTVLVGGEEGEKTVAFSSDGRFLAASGGGGKLQVWDLAAQSGAGALMPATTIDSLGLVYSVAFSPDGTSLAAATEEGTVYLWNMAALLATAKPGEPGVHPTATLIQEDEQSTDTSYTLTWTWSRFNEDLGEVPAPPLEDIKTP